MSANAYIIAEGGRKIKRYLHFFFKNFVNASLCEKFLPDILNNGDREIAKKRKQEVFSQAQDPDFTGLFTRNDFLLKGDYRCLNQYRYTLKQRQHTHILFGLGSKGQGLAVILTITRFNPGKNMVCNNITGIVGQLRASAFQMGEVVPDIITGFLEGLWQAFVEYITNLSVLVIDWEMAKSIITVLPTMRSLICSIVFIQILPFDIILNCGPQLPELEQVEFASSSVRTTISDSACQMLSKCVEDKKRELFSALKGLFS